MYPTLTATQIEAPAKGEAPMTLAQLRQVKADWVADAETRGTLKAIANVIRQFGDPYTIRSRKADPAWLYEIDDVHALYTETVGAWLPAVNDFERCKIIVVTVGAGQWWQPPAVCRYRFTNAPTPDRSNYLFVPGDWLTPFLLQAGAAVETEVQYYQAVIETQRLAMLKELWLS